MSESGPEGVLRVARGHNGHEPAAGDADIRQELCDLVADRQVRDLVDPLVHPATSERVFA